IAEDSEEKMLHALRIECKKLRYLMEFFSSLFPAKEIALLIGQLKQLQNNLGEFNDLRVQQEHLSSIVTELSDEELQVRRTILAVGSLIGALDDKKLQVKEAFAQTFTDFMAPATQQLVKALCACQRKRLPGDNPGFV
ncbi:MAG TPA: CHAD domain-containing protein, partial [Anaerolineae bacterium]|nr:CHAD domain-containing protein [Anaerolineae bacterium]